MAIGKLPQINQVISPVEAAVPDNGTFSRAGEKSFRYIMATDLANILSNSSQGESEVVCMRMG